jgi:hypothetical protein
MTAQASGVRPRHVPRPRPRTGNLPASAAIPQRRPRGRAGHLYRAVQRVLGSCITHREDGTDRAEPRTTGGAVARVSSRRCHTHHEDTIDYLGSVVVGGVALSSTRSDGRPPEGGQSPCLSVRSADGTFRAAIAQLRAAAPVCWRRRSP